MATRKTKNKKTNKELKKENDESTNIWLEDKFSKYENRPVYLQNICLSDFISNYYKKQNSEYEKYKKLLDIEIRIVKIQKIIGEKW